MGRLFPNYPSLITQGYKRGTHNGIDLVGSGKNGAMCVDYILAHTAGTVMDVVNNYSTNDKTGSSYGNYVKIRHINGMYTLYAHMKFGSVKVKKGDRVEQGQVIGYMGNTGHSFGAHLHFEVRDVNNQRIDPTPFLEADLTDNPNKPISFVNGKAYVTQVELRVRSGPGTEYSPVGYSGLTEDGKKHDKDKDGALDAGTTITCLESKKINNDIWIHCPSGWIAAYYEGQYYVR